MGLERVLRRRFAGGRFRNIFRHLRVRRSLASNFRELQCVYPSSSQAFAGGRHLLTQALIAFLGMVHFKSTQGCVLSFQKQCSAEYLQGKLG